MAMNTIKFSLLGVFSVFLVAACAPHKTGPDYPLNNQLSPNVSQTETLESANLKTQGKKAVSASKISSWELSGAMAAKSASKGWTASLNWLQQGPNQYQMRLYGPLGGGTVLVEKKGAAVTYVDGPQRVSSTNPDELLQKQTGIRLPVRNLYYWVRGLPAPGSVQASQHDANGNLTALSQSGYTIHYGGYRTVNNISLPSKVQLQGHGTTIKLVVKHWQV
jgi:outer membrane lipoprotein LolB